MSLSNLNAALGATGLNIKVFITSIALNPTFIGFIVGFIGATAIYLLIMSEEKAHVLSMVFSTTPTSSFQRLANRNTDGTYEMSYTDFLRGYNRVRVLFFSCMLLFLLFILLTFLFA